MKNYLLLFAIIFSGSLLAQQEDLDCNNSSKIIKNDFRSDKSAVVIWEEDFDGGFPAGWGTYSANTGAGNNGTPSPEIQQNAHGSILLLALGATGTLIKEYLQQLQLIPQLQLMDF